MKKILFFFLLIIISPAANADEITNVLITLGVSREQFNDLWLNACPPDFQMKVPAATLSHKDSVVELGVQYGFLALEKAGREDSLIRSGPVCKALLAYYFDGSMSENSISQFIQKDKEFKSVYGVSVLDAWGLERYGSASMNGRIDEFSLRHWKELENKGLITIRSESSTFNGSPSKAYISTTTSKGESLKNAIAADAKSRVTE